MYIYTFDLFLSKLIRYDWPMRSKCVRIRFYPSKWIDGCWRAACTSGISTCRNSYSGSLHSQKKFIHLWIIRCGRLGPKGTRYGNQYRWIINLWNDISCKAAFSRRFYRPQPRYFVYISRTKCTYSLQSTKWW